LKKDYQDLLRPEIINSVSGLSLIARVVVDGYLSGHNRSRRVGAGLEFSQYRGYGPGDDLRLLDWKMLARSGRYYIKQSEIDTHTTVKFVLDASKSMQHTENGRSKMDYAKVLTASLAYLAQHQGDAIGLYALNAKQLHQLRPRVSKRHFQRFLHRLVHVNAEGKWPIDPITFEKLQNPRQKELLFFITDFYEYGRELTRAITSLKTPRNEVVVLQLMGRKELEFDYSDYIIFEDLETGNKVKVDAKSAKPDYLKSLSALLSHTKDDLLRQGIGYQIFLLDEPIAEALRLFLKRRSNLE